MELNTFVESGHQFSKAPLETLLASIIEMKDKIAEDMILAAITHPKFR